jgi:hypothetical protein
MTDYYKKYNKYKTKYINLKKGGMIDVLTQDHIVNNTNIQSYDDLLLSKIADKFNTAINNHIHELCGFVNLESGEYYLIKNLSLKNNILLGENIKINNLDIIDKKIENDLYDDMTLLRQIKSLIITFIHDNKNKLKYMSNIIINRKQTEDIIIDFIKIENEQTGGFNGVIKCDNVKLNGLAKIYSEPVISTLHELILNYYYNTLKPKNDKIRKFPFDYGKLIIQFSRKNVDDEDINEYFKYIMDSISKKYVANFEKMKQVLSVIGFNKDMLLNGEYIQKIMLYHLLNNRYAHNGVDEKEILDKLSILLGKELLDIDNLLFIHSYLHCFDQLIMMKYDRINTKYNSEGLKILRSCLKKSINIMCYEKFLNIYKYDFLEKTPDNKYLLPYKIKPEAFEDKKKQYDNNDEIHVNFLKQIIGREIKITDSTEEPYGYYTYLKNTYLTKYPDIIDFINTNVELNKIKTITKDIRLSSIVKIFNKKYKDFTKDDIINLIMVFSENFIYEFETMV